MDCRLKKCVIIMGAARLTGLEANGLDGKSELRPSPAKVHVLRKVMNVQ
jgi:hypothetical protein